MGYHTFDIDRAAELEDAARRYRFLSAEELCWALDAAADDVVADIGSGTGFFTDVIAPHARLVYAVDLQPEMHEYYRRKGVPDTVALVTGTAAGLPFVTASLDGVVSTMTFHEFASDAALAELHRVLAADGTLVVADWAGSGTGTAGPPLDERFRAAEAADALHTAGFTVTHRAVRPETFLLTATPASA
jgi:ubiquinone/menaquinone biosynthesis C-methylase UbiE